MGRRYTEAGSGWRVTASMRTEYGAATYDVQLKGDQRALDNLKVAVKRARQAMTEGDG